MLSTRRVHFFLLLDPVSTSPAFAELGNEVPKGVPVFFLKPPSSLVGMPGRIERPARCQDLHHEVELGLVIGKQGRHIKPEHALTHVAGYVLALDMTARDQQDAAKKKGLPWSGSPPPLLALLNPLDPLQE